MNLLAKRRLLGEAMATVMGTPGGATAAERDWPTLPGAAEVLCVKLPVTVPFAHAPLPVGLMT